MRFLFLLLLTASVAHAAAIPPAQFDRIHALVRDHKLREAERAAQALVAAHPGEPEAHALLGSVRIDQGDAGNAVAEYEKAAELAPANSGYQRELGDTYGFAAQQAGMLSKMSWAKKCGVAYEKAVELDPKNLAARSSLMAFYQQAPALIGGGLDKAYAQAAAIKEADATRGLVAYAMLNIGEKKYGEASAKLEEVLRTEPDNYTALYQVGRIAALSGEQIDRGIAALQRCLTLPPTTGAPGHDAANWRLGNLWEKKGDKAVARAAYQAALAVTPSFPQAIDALKKLD
ncbi:MAG: tetratricopeptide repeat protein [Lacunisphaera sp.]